MPDLEPLRRQGLFLAPDFLDGRVCREVRSRMDEARKSPVTIVRGGDALRDEQVRRSRAAKVPAATAEAVHNRVSAIMPDLERHFGLNLTRTQTLQFLVYEAGDFFKAHQDGAMPGGRPELVERKVSVVIFLNEEERRGRRGDYIGGTLAFYRLSGPANGRIPVAGREGLLVGFLSNSWHEVTRLTRGTRYSIVGWFI